MKVCHMTSAHQRYDVRVFEKECASLAKGHEVYLVVNDDKDSETNKNVSIVSTNYVPKNRLDRMFFSTIKVLKKGLALDADVYQLHDPELLPLIPMLKKHGKKVIFDAHEDTAEQIMDKNWIPISLRVFVSKIYSLYAAIILRKADAVITVTPQLVEKFSRYNPRTILITNYPILTEFKAFDYLDNFSDPKVCFAGGISEQWRHKTIIESLDDLDTVKYVLAGSPSGYLEQLKRLKSWNKVIYLGQVPHDKVEEIQKQSVAGMAVNYANQIKGKGTLGNTKLFEYMAAGIPVICTNYELWKEIIDKYNCGICVNPDSVNDIRNAISCIINNPDVSKKMGENGRKAVEESFSWGSEEKKLFELYSTI